MEIHFWFPNTQNVEETSAAEIKWYAFQVTFFIIFSVDSVGEKYIQKIVITKVKVILFGLLFAFSSSLILPFNNNNNS